MAMTATEQTEQDKILDRIKVILDRKRDHAERNLEIAYRLYGDVRYTLCNGREKRHHKYEQAEDRHAAVFERAEQIEAWLVKGLRGELRGESYEKWIGGRELSLTVESVLIRFTAEDVEKPLFVEEWCLKMAQSL